MSCNTCGCLSRGITDISPDNNTVSIREGLLKMTSTDWLAKYDELKEMENIVEVRFKNTRKEYFRNEDGIKLKIHDIVAVETNKGHDIGTISLTGQLAMIQMMKNSSDRSKNELKRIYRKARPEDLRKWKEALHQEPFTLMRTKQIINELQLQMKLSQVEYQGDLTKATFYYIAEERVDFRELIKILAREFKVRVEMKQIGARQEAGMVGGLGSCGRELCCSSWKKNFNTVSLDAVKYQELPINVQKLAGQCGKLKCCMMYEVDSYIEARKELPQVLLNLETLKGIAYYQKADVLKRWLYYSYNIDGQEELIPVTVEKVKEIIALNKKGVRVDLFSESAIETRKDKLLSGSSNY